MKRSLLLLAMPLAAHTISMSTGRLQVEGIVARYTVEMPAYELQHVREPERTVLGSIDLAGARLAERRCEQHDAAYVCEGKYVFNAAPETVQVTVRLHEAVVSNHVHVLHARRDNQLDQAVFTAANPSALLEFREADALEAAVRSRPSSLLAFVILVFALATLPRTHREIWLVASAFVGGTLVAELLPWRLTPAFTEATLGIVAAYAAFEALSMPNSRYNWLSSTALGIAAALYAHVLVPASPPRVFLAGCAIAISMAAALALQRWQIATRPLRTAVLTISLIWFAVMMT